MNEQERAEFERLKRQLASAQHELDLLWMQIREFEARLTAAPQPSVPSNPAPVSTPAALPHTPEPSKPPPLPPIIPPAPVFATVAPRPAAAPTAQVLPKQDVPPTMPAPGPSPTSASSFEMRLGTYWLVRIGIVMLLTALVFFGKYAYQNFIMNLGAAGKLALMYLGGAALLFVGAWLQRGREAVRNYGQVVFAGGLAAVYFTTYAAHHIPNLRVIQSALLDGWLLLGWAGFMAFLADRKKSELLSLFAVGLAYYTSVITNIGLFTLCSNLILTATAIFFLVRHRWATLSFLSLAATYFAFAYWRYFHDGAWLWTDRETARANFWPGNLFLLSYWILFTAAAFLSRHQKLVGANRATFVTVNNSALFLLVTMSLVQTYRAEFWFFSIGYGAVLLALSLAAGRFLSSETVVSGNYLTQGLLLATVGLISKFSGLQLALLLATESAVLILLGQQQKNLILRIGSFLAAALAVGSCIDGLRQFDTPGVYRGAGIGLLMAFNAWWSRRHDEEPDKSLLRPQATYFSVLALLVWLVTTWHNTSRENFALVLAAEGLILTASIYAIRLREFAVLAQGYVVWAQLFWLLDHLQSQAGPWWNPALLISITLALSHWWQRQTALKLEPSGSQVLQSVYALAAVGVLYFWLHSIFTPPVWLALAGLLALALTAYGALTRAWRLAASGQIFVAVSAWEFMRQLARDHPDWFFALAPIATLALLSFATVLWFRRHAEVKTDLRETLLGMAMIYRWVGLAMSLAWVHEYIPARERFWVFSLLGLLAYLGSGWRRSREGLVSSAVLTWAGLLAFWFEWDHAPTVYLPNLVAILVLLGQQRLARRVPANFAFQPEIHALMILPGGLSLWVFVSRWVLQESSGFYLTVSWAVLAFLLFVTGLGLRERMYRWLGLAVLGSALGRVVIFDVWKLPTIYRIASFFALGIVLLVLGFIYTRYEEKIKEWL